MKAGGWESKLPNAVDYDEFLATGDKGPFKWPDLHENSGAYLYYTSGTTGKPKGVCYSHRSTILHCLAFNYNTDTLSVSAKDCVLSLVPLFHAGGWGMPIVGMHTGQKIVMNGPFAKPDMLLRVFKEEKVTISCGVPTIWNAI